MPRGTSPPDHAGLSSTLPPAPRPLVRVLAALGVALFAFGLYRSTLLPGVDFGDTASFQAAVGYLDLSPRQAYPLYFFIGDAVARIAGGEPAFGLNLSSAICGALAAGVLVWAGSALTGSTLAGCVGALLLATSYTFWTQAIIAEVYALHLLMMGLVIAALLWWERRRTLARLALVFAVYALSYGNHLMTVLLAPAIVLFVITAPGGLRLLFAPRTIAVAALCATAGACQYPWNAAYLWTLPTPPSTWSSLVRTFWFDVTKSDWRETMVFAVHPSSLSNRVGMYRFDVLQQFGEPGLLLALVGVVYLCWRPRLALLVVSGYLTAFVFAYTYNVGDAHVFFLPSHQMIAIAACAGAAAVLSLAGRLQRGGNAAPIIAALVMVAYPLWRAWDTGPAVDRHEDRRPVEWLSAVARGLDQRSVLLADVNWQLENGFDYYQHFLHPELNMLRATDAVLTLPFLIRDNLADGRQVFATPAAMAVGQAAYGDALTFDPDPGVDVRPLLARIGQLPPGAIYVLAVLEPYPDLSFDVQELTSCSRGLTGGAASLGREQPYTVIAGVAGRRPSLDRRSDRPWRERVRIGDVDLDLRMESWLPADTIRRAGFGQVVANRRHVLILERGVSVVALSPDGQPLTIAYASSLFAPLARYRVGLAGPVRPGPTP